MSTLSKDDIQIATRAAESFTRLYYKTYDSPTRVKDLPGFYRDTSAIAWNGKPFQGVAGIKALMEGMPKTRHEVQSYDCHPIPTSQPPSLLVTVSGTVQHGKGPAGNPPNTKPKTQDGQPRVFSQAFMLVPDTTAAPVKTGEVGKYYISSDAMRFVG